MGGNLKNVIFQRKKLCCLICLDWRNANGGFCKWGSRIHKISKFCFGPKLDPKGPLGLTMGPPGPNKSQGFRIRAQKIKKKNFENRKNVF